MRKVCGLAAVAMGALMYWALTLASGQAETAKQPKTAPASLVDVGHFGENVYDQAKAKDWIKVADKYKALGAAAKQLATDLKGAEGLKRLDSAMTGLAKSVPAKDVEATKREANQVTLIAADMIEPFNPQVPADVTRLDYFGRELEIWVVAKDMAKLKTTADAIGKTWSKLQPAVMAKGGAAEAKRFSALVTQVTAAKTVEEYDRVATPILDEVDNLEGVFKK